MSLPQDIDPAHSGDLQLAADCLGGHRAALITIERDYLAPIVASLERPRFSSSDMDEVMQQLREKLLAAGSPCPFSRRDSARDSDSLPCRR
jgi:hypothetical protein